MLEYKQTQTLFYNVRIFKQNRPSLYNVRIKTNKEQYCKMLEYLNKNRALLYNVGIFK